MDKLIEIFGIQMYLFPIIVLLAVYACIWIFLHSTKYDQFYYFGIKESGTYAMVSTVICGKLLYMITKILKGTRDVWNLFNGFVFYGGFLGMILGLYVFSYRNKIRVGDVADVYASFLPLGQSIGRIGCYFNGCCYGRPYSGFGAVNYIIDGVETTVFPTWFVEAVFCLLLFLCFFLISKRIYSGMYLACYMILYGIFRYVIENYRGDKIRGIWFGISTSQYISIIIIIFGICYAFYSARYKRRNLIIVGRDKIG